LDEFCYEPECYKYPPRNKGIKKKEEDKSGNKAVFKPWFIGFINTRADTQAHDESCTAKKEKIPKSNDPARKIAAIPKYGRPESQKEKKKEQDVNWKESFFHVIIIERVSSFRNHLESFYAKNN
jgi:hypothetical protein